MPSVDFDDAMVHAQALILRQGFVQALKWAYK
jgi:hypothetical protein